MPWTGEDTKDVLKKVLGGLIAAAILAMVYALLEDSPWYVALSLGVVLVILILVTIWRLRRIPSVAADASAANRPSEALEPPADAGPSSALTKSSGDAQPPSSSDDHPLSDAGQKAAKKAAKAEQKRLKKEAKSREKLSKP
ncbi:MAG: hypothetical protein JSV90_06410 [Methanobacteriota archaeon]|nr:MAG: hypothetical protein JSV90_06410 [Euryarchaeota archaeon]